MLAPFGAQSICARLLSTRLGTLHSGARREDSVHCGNARGIANGEISREVDSCVIF